ncbi:MULTISPECIES: hypothetical protein [Metallosphaera]|uniref:hypothetical protein n=1 Tax=Metallosphaera TaxID=41980 RepID=UPI001F065435|nr:hypothetical protein [Metallosphaera sedula]MCH1772185.1 hypothetical protein [Metallosphaera sedula]MCP6727731.1 hypothetical protein [Metallosphaera sedula]
MNFVYAIGDRTIPYPNTRREIADKRRITFTSGVMHSLQEMLSLNPSSIEVGIARNTLVNYIHSLGSQGILHGEVHYCLAKLEDNKLPDLDNLLAYNLNRNEGRKYDEALKRGAVLEKMPQPIRPEALAEYLFYRNDSSTFQHYEMGDPILSIEVQPSGNDKQKKAQIAEIVRRQVRGVGNYKLTISIWVTPERISSNNLKVIIDGVVTGLLGNRPTGSRDIINPPDSLDRLVAIRMLPRYGMTKVTVNPVIRAIPLHKEIGQVS